MNKFYKDGELWYETEDGFEFPISIADTGTGVFKAEDNAIRYMRWIRKHLAERLSGKKSGKHMLGILPAIQNELPLGNQKSISTQS